ncbi:phosphate ABC transporter permease subunit PstC [Lacticaseibacillus salsurivasis]|uniref:phosphate ABC transporter permease subunit PstC n=1 Tax=Lacticaseibacillus salsurivasis TaxID=3081441 RepID=UPI0030C6B8F9
MPKENNELIGKSKETREDYTGRILCFFCITLVVILVVSILYFVTSKGASTFIENHASLWDFLTNTTWNPGQIDTSGKPQVGAAPMIVTSFSVTLFAALLTTPFAFAVALFISEYASKNGKGILQAVLELLVGIPSVVYGFIGLTVVVPAIRHLYGGTGFGILAGTFVLFVMILPTVSSLAVESLRAIPSHYKQGSLALGATRWQTIFHVTLRAATPGLITSIIFGMARAFGEALAVQMVIGNAALMPKNLISPAATLTSQLTTQIGNTVMGNVANNALWSLALVLLAMSLFFNLLVRLIAKRGEIKK